MLTLALTLALQPAEQPAPPRKTDFIVYGDYGAPGKPGNIETLLREWLEGGVIQGRVQRSVTDASTCVGRRPRGKVDQNCLRRLHPGSAATPALIITAFDSGRVIPVYDVTCIGLSGSGVATVNMNIGGAYSHVPAQRAQIRDAMVNCIKAAAPAAIAVPQ